MSPKQEKNTIFESSDTCKTSSSSPRKERNCCKNYAYVVRRRVNYNLEMFRIGYSNKQWLVMEWAKLKGWGPCFVLL